LKLRIRVPRRISPSQAIALQQKLAPLIKDESELPSKVTYLVGCDATYIGGNTIAAATLVNFDSLNLVESRVIRERTSFPYVPGLLAFREGPPVLRVIRSLRARSYVCLVDAHGLAHPRRFGLACFVGLALDRPTVGVAKSLLYGEQVGNQVVDEGGRQIAAALPLPGSAKSVYVSVGHNISLNDAVRIVRRCLSPRGPIPIRLAHEEVTRQKWRLKN
jgi:deoxyribonuclease V